MSSHYEILGVPRSATAEEIRSAYRRFALKYHPDRNPDADAMLKFNEISGAYSVLCDQDKRRKYDATLPVRVNGRSSQNKRPSFFDIGKKIEEAFKNGPVPRKIKPKRGRTSGARTKVWPDDLVRFENFELWVREKLKKKFGRSVVHFAWRTERVEPTDFLEQYVHPHGFELNEIVVESLVEMVSRTARPPSPVFMDALGPGRPTIWGKHKAAAAKELGLGEFEIFVRVK
jgi:curved DNA-binding protein CbpA